MSQPPFDELLAMYFAGQLDRVERRTLDRMLDEDAGLSARFDAAYDARTEEAGLLALAAPAPELNECFSFATLERFVRGQLDDEAEGWVQSHLACPLCRAQVEALRVSTKRDASNVIQGPWRRPMVAGVTALAASLLVAVVVSLPPSSPSVDRPARYRGAVDSVANRSQLTSVLTLPPSLITEPAVSGVEAGVRPALSLSARQPVYVAVATGTVATSSRWIYPPPSGVNPSPSMARLQGGVSQRIELDLPNDGAAHTVWLFVSPTDYNVEVLRAVRSDGPVARGGWLFSEYVFNVNVKAWRIVRP